MFLDEYCNTKQIKANLRWVISLLSRLAEISGIDFKLLPSSSHFCSFFFVFLVSDADRISAVTAVYIMQNWSDYPLWKTSFLVHGKNRSLFYQPSLPVRAYRHLAHAWEKPTSVEKCNSWQGRREIISRNNCRSVCRFLWVDDICRRERTRWNLCGRRCQGGKANGAGLISW